MVLQPRYICGRKA